MKHFLAFLLCLCLLCSLCSAYALDLPDMETADQFAERIRTIWEDLDIREKLDDLDLDGLGADLRALAAESAELSDSALEARIRAIAEKHGVTLDDGQVQKVVKIFRSYEKGVDVKGKAETLKEKAAGVVEFLRSLAHKASSFFLKLGGLLQKI